MPPPTSTPTRRAKDRRRREVQRRRAAALVVIALVILAISIAIGDAGGGSQSNSGPHARLTGAARLHAIAELARRRTAAEDRAIDRIMTYTPFVISGGGQKREVALTFDDGPGPYTTQVLRVLRRLNVKATFFEVGFMERWFHSSTAQALREGHTVGDHTESHPKLGQLPRTAQRDQIVSQAEWLNRLGAPEPRLFRPPFGSFNDNTFTVLRRNRMLMVLWSVDSQDYRQPGAKAIVQRVLRGARPGAIVLMHDAGGVRSQTIAALPKIVRRLRRRHYRLVTVPQLMLDDPPPHGQRLPHYVNGVG